MNAWGQMDGVAVTKRPSNLVAVLRAAEMRSDVATLVVAAVEIHSCRHPFPIRKDADVLSWAEIVK